MSVQFWLKTDLPYILYFFLFLGELRDNFKYNEPKIIFCQKEREEDVELALQDLKLNSQIVTFDKGGKNMCFSDFLDKYGSNASIEDFQ